MGFDDGPAHGTRDVLGALEKNNVKVRKENSFTNYMDPRLK